jgi:hypothetical protein
MLLDLPAVIGSVNVGAEHAEVSCYPARPMGFGYAELRDGELLAVAEDTHRVKIERARRGSLLPMIEMENQRYGADGDPVEVQGRLVRQGGGSSSFAEEVILRVNQGPVRPSPRGRR